MAINYTNVSANLTNFPVLFSLTDNDLRNHAMTNGYDILFTAADGTNKLAHEIESYNRTNGALVAWVKVPILSSTTNTLLYLYYGNASAGNQQNASAVWDPNFCAVWHLDEAGSGVAGEYKDSTTNGRHAQGMGSVPKQMVGKIGTSQSFNGTSAYIQSGSAVGITGNATRTLSFWANVTSATTVPFAGWGLNGNDALFVPGVYSGELTLAGDGTGNDWTGIAPAQAGSWLLHTIVYDGTTVRWYVNGSQAGSGFAHTYATGNGPMVMGYSTYSGAYYLNGSLEEVRVSNVARPLAWLQTEYTNQNSPATFSAVGSQAEAPASSLVVTSVNGGSAPTAGTAFSVVVQAETSAGLPQNATNNTTVTLSLYAGSSSLGGTLTGTIAAGTSSVTLTGITYLKAESGVEVMAAASSGDALIAGNSAPFTVNPGSFTKLQMLMPGETAAPGSGTGKTGMAAPETAGTAFNVTVNAVDANWNLVSTTDRVSITANDPNASLPASAALVAGTKTFGLTLKTAGVRTVTASDATNGGISSNTSPATTVNPGSLKKLQLLVPGETAAPGTTTGNTGTPTAETAGITFNVTVNAVDAYWNLISTNDNVVITSSDAKATLPTSAALVGGTQTLSVTLKTATNGANVTATDATHAAITASTSPLTLVYPGPLQHFAFAAIGAQTYALPFNVSITAQDLNNNTATNFCGQVNLTTTAGAVNPGLSGAFVSGVLTQSVAVTLSGTGETLTATQTGGSATGNSAPFTVNQVPLTVTANNANQIYGATNPVFTANYTGFVNGDTVGVVQGAPVFTTYITANSGVGSYAITPSLGTLAATNYSFPTFRNGTLTITQAQTTNVVSASLNPAPSGSNVTLTTTLTALPPGAGTPTGTVNFRIDGNVLGSGPLSGGIASFTTDSLARGAHTVIAEYAGDGNFLGSTNRLSPNQVIDTAPVAGDVTILRNPALGVQIRLTALLTNASESYGDALNLVVSPTSGSNATVTVSGGWVFYTPPSGFTKADSFTYTVTDSLGLSATGTVTVDIQVDNGQSQNLTETDLGGGSILIHGNGIPGYTYHLQYSDTCTPFNWQDIESVTADSTGQFRYTDTADSPTRFYRTVCP